MAAAAALMAATAYTPALAQNFLMGPTGYQAGDIMAHLSVIGVIPENFDSHVRLGSTVVPGERVHTSDGISPELDASYFFTPNLSLELIAATTRHNVFVRGPLNVSTGSTWVLPPTLTAQWHFAQVGDVRPYAGLGVTVAFFYGEGSSAFLKTAGLKNGGLYTSAGPSLDLGFDVPLSGNWSANVDVKQIFLITGKHIGNGAIGALTELDPTVVGIGVGYKF
ncbi:OmpW family protein [Acidocella sp.]|uniref:OmpW/AlkL family protein n=1 Tax=Acidocella sp. TaxID=50710 RepID=UPI0026126B40|nr:OmpW family outer membrane protein [Acidocella sp.]